MSLMLTFTTHHWKETPEKYCYITQVINSLSSVPFQVLYIISYYQCNLDKMSHWFYKQNHTSLPEYIHTSQKEIRKTQSLGGLWMYD